MKKNDGKESNTAKGVNIAIEFNEFKDVLFGKKVIRHKMKRIQSKKHKLGSYEIDKISLSCFDDKRFCQMMEFIRWLIFIKIVLQVVKRFKQVMIKKRRFKKIVIKEEEIKKDCERLYVSNRTNSVVM